MAGTPSEPPYSLAEVLDAEHAHLHGGSGQPSEKQCGHSALCLSGGGIRSASFALGIIQGLARLGILGSFDYLSTVSGGGFAGGWLSAWLFHRGPGKAGSVFEELRSGKHTGEESADPEPVARMRAASRYMSPEIGFFSADMWALIATVARNLLLNAIVLLPLVAAALLSPHFYLALIQNFYHPVLRTGTLTPGAVAVLALSGMLTAFSIGFVIMNLPSYGDRRSNQRKFLMWSLAPLCAGSAGLTLFWSMEDSQIGWWHAALAGAAIGAATWTVCGRFARSHHWRPRTSAGAALAGSLAAAGLLTAGDHLFRGDVTCGRLFATTAVPFVFGVLMLATFAFIGVASSDIGDDDLEWWSRVASWVLIVAVAWLVIHAVVYYGPAGLRLLRAAIEHSVPGLKTDERATGAIGVATSILGAVVAYLSRIKMAQQGHESSVTTRVTLAVGAPALAVLVLASVAWVNEELLAKMFVRRAGFSADIDACSSNYLPEVIILAGVFLVCGFVMGWFVSVNQFSLHGMYRERLIRAFLGASRTAAARQPNPFTGFDPADDVSMSALASIQRPIHVVNMTLNRVAEARKARLHRKAESFTASPLFVGSPTLGFRPTAKYASNSRSGRGGLSLGTAMAISGAAASPNMGGRSSPAVTFLLALFNARLGAWLGNPGPAGERTWRESEPRQGVMPLLREMLGRTSGSGAYVYLSDGGHYENLGLAQMVLRRCKYILVSDATSDPRYTFQDLANAVRQVRIDLGVPITFNDGCRIDQEHQGKGNPHYCIGRIDYGAVDGPEAEAGILIYIKATLSGDEPIDVIHYAKAHAAFPHESTAEQWFGEAQFESYRMLGYHSVMQMAEDYRGGDLPGLFSWVLQRGSAASPGRAATAGTAS